MDLTKLQLSELICKHAEKTILLPYVEEVLNKDLESKRYPLKKQVFNPYQTVMILATHLRPITYFNGYKYVIINPLNQSRDNFDEDEY